MFSVYERGSSHRCHGKYSSNARQANFCDSSTADTQQVIAHTTALQKGSRETQQRACSDQASRLREDTNPSSDTPPRPGVVYAAWSRKVTFLPRPFLLRCETRFEDAHVELQKRHGIDKSRRSSRRATTPKLRKTRYPKDSITRRSGRYPGIRRPYLEPPA